MVRRSERLRNRRQSNDHISVSSTSTSTSAAQAPATSTVQAPPPAEWRIVNHHDTALTLSLADDRVAHISAWLSHHDQYSYADSEASTISYDAYRETQNQTIQNVLVDVVNGENQNQNNQNVLMGVVNEEMEEYEIDDVLSENDFVRDEMVHPLTFVNYLNTLEDEVGGINCSLCDFSLVHSQMGHATVTMCGHVFHEMCIQKIQMTSNSCPKCRQHTRAWENERIYF